MPHMCEKMWHLTLCARFISNNLSVSSFIQVVREARISFLLKLNTIHCAYARFFLHIHRGWMLRLPPLVTAVSNGAVNTGAQVCCCPNTNFSFLNTNLAIWLLDHVVEGSLTFWGTSMVIHNGCANWHSHQQSASFPFPHVLPDVYHFFLPSDLHLYIFFW